MRAMTVVGGSRGLGAGIARAGRDAGLRVTVVARESGDERGDATDETFAEKVLATHRPDVLVIAAGAVPEMRPLTEQTWESFSVNWNADVRIAFTWLRAALRAPLAPGSRIIAVGSGAELRGSPLSGGYAGAKATVRLITGYAATSGITTTTILPGITPGTSIGETAISAYAVSSGSTSDEFRSRLSAPTPDAFGASVVALAAEPTVAAAYVLDADGLRPLAAQHG
ncbi:SDR family oxidoreductase [Actinoplanes bogorensis]|uniref:SDR family oxidoreductase n=1 Tax=Paractinoplanes bogorensis TaxID=1610840 RepID=A0ABS5YR82_9ACTN|nr:SDR family oxidoreductase [Actinoplanes bogorensis]MBU2665968.1 SDR family oxidoreductase [Actinoplanes bogorensis]